MHGIAKAIVADVLVFRKGDTAVFLSIENGEFRHGDRVRVSRGGSIVGETVIYPRDGSTRNDVSAGRPPHALVKEIICSVGDVIESCDADRQPR